MFFIQDLVAKYRGSGLKATFVGKDQTDYIHLNAMMESDDYQVVYTSLSVPCFGKSIVNVSWNMLSEIREIRMRLYTTILSTKHLQRMYMHVLALVRMNYLSRATHNLITWQLGKAFKHTHTYM